MVATPGRLLELNAQQWLDMSVVDMLVIDEADRMLDMGFIESIQQIADVLPQSRQTLMFSATLESDKIKSSPATSSTKMPAAWKLNSRGIFLITSSTASIRLITKSTKITCSKRW
ncbi:DEAD/DEAH box helicase [Aliamphritea spongicola]|nr:DEAD/DEAH box helicase [Aliamphritea spongicola]